MTELADITQVRVRGKGMDLAQQNDSITRWYEFDEDDKTITIDDMVFGVIEALRKQQEFNHLLLKEIEHLKKAIANKE